MEGDLPLRDITQHHLEIDKVPRHVTVSARESDHKIYMSQLLMSWRGSQIMNERERCRGKEERDTVHTGWA